MTSDGPPTTQRTLPPRLVWATLALAAVVAAYYVGVKGPRRSAFVRWQPQIQGMLAGEDAYTRWGFPTPPVMALLLAPLAALPASVGMAAWLVLKVALTLLALSWLVRQQRDAWRRRPGDAVPAVALAASAVPIIADLMHGNINLWILFLVVASWRAFRTGRPVLAGLILSLAVACKVTPALLLVYFVWKREWKLTATAGVGLVCWLLVVPALWFGWDRNLYLLDRWSGLMLRPYVAEGRAERDVRNQSLAGLFQRLTSPPAESPPTSGAEDALRADLPINLVFLDAETSKSTWRGIAIALLAGLWLLTRGPTPATDRRWLEHEFALVLLGMLLLSERSWKHHYVTILPSFMALFSWIDLRRGAGRCRAFVTALSGVAAALLVLTSQDVLGTLAGDAAVEHLQAYGVYAWAGVLLIACHWAVRGDLDGGTNRLAHDADVPGKAG